MEKIFIFKGILGLIILLIIITPVFSLGITPGRTTLEFSSNLERELEFDVINSENKNMVFAFSVEGDLAEYVTLDNKIENFTSNQKMKTFKYKVNLPDKIPPGVHEAKIIATELQEDFVNDDILIKSTVSVVTQLHVYSPYPGKYIDAKFDIVSNDKTNIISFFIPIINRGEEDINEVSANIDIYKNEELLTTVNTEKYSVKRIEKRELNATWLPEVEPGKYIARAEIYYDGKKLYIDKEFQVGNESLDVLSIGVNNFKLGGVAKIKILVQNKLSDPILKSFSQIDMYDSNFNRIDRLVSEDYEIAAKSNKEMALYWETESLEKGDYRAELLINFDNKKYKKNFKVRVAEDYILFSGVGFAVASEGWGNFDENTILYLVIIILVLLNIFVLIWIIRRRKKKY